MDGLDLAPYASVVAFPLLWIAICHLLGAMGGWRRLAEQYPYSGAAPSGLARFRSGRLGWVNYGNCLTVGATPSGLYLSVFFLFRPGHAPLLVPWHEVSAEAAGGWIKHVRLQFSRAPSVRLRLSGRYPEVVRLASGSSPVPDVA